MKKVISIFSTRRYVINSFTSNMEKLKLDFNLKFYETRLHDATVPLSKGSDAVVLFVNDKANASVLEQMNSYGIRNIAMRCAGYNNVDLVRAKELGFTIANVPRYSPYAVAEHAACLILALNRKLKKSIDRARDANFELEGLLGFDLYGKTVGVCGAGKIGECFIKIMAGFGTKILYNDMRQNEEVEKLGAKRVDINTLLAESDIISLHCPLTKESKHFINETHINMMKNGVMLINTSRGGLMDSKACLEGIKSGKIGYLGIDVYEKEEELFFTDHSDDVIRDDVFMSLLSHNNVIITGHQAFFTKEAINNIAETTLSNLNKILNNQPCENTLKL